MYTYLSLIPKQKIAGIWATKDFYASGFYFLYHKIYIFLFYIISVNS